MSYLNPAKRQRAIGQGGDVYSQQISADVVPGPEPRYYTTYLTGTQGEDEGAHGEIALFQEMRTTNLVPRTSAYQVAVEKACVDTKALPSFIAQVDQGSSNPSGNINQLQSQVGFEMNWSGSMFPSTLNGSTIAIDTTLLNSTTPTLYSFFSTGGSSLPIKYARSSYGVGLSPNDLKKTPPACEGTLQAYIENNPNSPYWQGQFNFNLDIQLFLLSFNRALVRAFGSWEPTSPNYAWTTTPTETSAGSGQWYLSCSYTASQLTILDLSQILVSSATNLGGTEPGYADLYEIIQDFYPTIFSNYVSGANILELPCSKKQNEFFTKYKKTIGTPPAFRMTLYAANPTYGSAPTVSVAGGTATQTIPSSTQLPVPTSSNVTNADNMATLTFTITTTPSANASTVTVPSFDFYQGISGTKIQCLNTSVSLQNQDMESPYVSSQPSRLDYVTSAYLLGFEADTVFNLVQATSAVVYANRPLAPAFSTKIDLSSYEPLMWRPSDVYAETAKPLPGSPYYYGYGTSYYLDNVVNPGIANCFQNQYDDYFTGELPSVIMQKLTLLPNIDAITDLSLNGQLYCTTYFNSGAAPLSALRDIKPWKANDNYEIGTPVTFANPDPNSPINNLYIANVRTGTVDFQAPEPFKNTDFWLYCGPFIYSSAVLGAKYSDGELVTYNGYATRVTSTNNATGGVISVSNGTVYHTFSTVGTFTFTPRGQTIKGQALIVGGGGAGGFNYFGGGGGAGDVFMKPFQTSSAVSIVVGAGGTPGNPVGDGGSSSLGLSPPIVATGGGGGAGGTTATGGRPGACGGGGSGGFGGGSVTPGAGTGSQGRPGGAGSTSPTRAGGGGGYSAAGATGAVSGNGGAGVTMSLYNKTYTVGGGGGGGANTGGAAGVGGVGGGGNGSINSTQPATNGAANTGGGGGGMGGDPPGSGQGGAGGSGLVVLAYPVARDPITFSGLFGTPMTLVPRDNKVEQVATGGQYIQQNGYAFHIFTEPGTASLDLIPGTNVSSLTCSVLTVGGGGGGGGASCGGGGAGGTVTVGANIVTSGGLVTVGAGGTGGIGTQGVIATGGTKQQVGDYTWHIFNQHDTGLPFVLTDPPNLNIQYLLVGGGGGGGGQLSSGGGGGGEVTSGTMNLTAGSYTVTVGSGGEGSSSFSAGDSGAPSAFNGISVKGGGGGGSYYGPGGTAANGLAGGCGGGGGGCDPGETAGSGGAAVEDGVGGAGFQGAGGGGGGYASGSPGNGGTANAAGVGANGGQPWSITLNGSSTPSWFSGGGGGGGESVGGKGGYYGDTAPYTYLGGDGGIGQDSTPATFGADDTGSGGGGAGNYNNSVGGAGSGGIVIIIYKTNAELTSAGQNGGTSSFQTVSAAGGGGGGGIGEALNGVNGANGGGGGGGYPGTTAGNGGTSTLTPPGYAGGNGYYETGPANPISRGGGGGGALQAGGDGTPVGGAYGGLGSTISFLGGITFTVAGGGGGGAGIDTAPGGGSTGGGDGTSLGDNGGNATFGFFNGWGSGGGGCGGDPGLSFLLVGGNGAPGLVVISYPLQDYVFFGQYNLLKPTPVVGTATPLMVLDVKPGDKGDVFKIQADTYGFGTYDSKNPRDPILAYARDSWGCLQSNATSFITNRIYDEYLQFSCNTAFRDMFRGFSATAEQYVNQLNGQTSTYWLHDFILSPADTFTPDMPPSWYDASVMNDGITQSSLRYLPPRMVSNTSSSQTSGSFLRNSDAQVYYWTITSSETSRYSMWDPVQSILIEGNTVPVSADNLPVSGPVTTQVQSLSGDTRLIIAEFFPKSNPAEATALYEPQFPRQIYLATGTELKYFSYRIGWRNKFTGEVVPLVLSSSGSAMVVFMFTPKN